MPAGEAQGNHYQSMEGFWKAASSSQLPSVIQVGAVAGILFLTNLVLNTSVAHVDIWLAGSDGPCVSRHIT
jgi:hypothetical protein